MTFSTKLFKTNWERVKTFINKNGNAGVIKKPLYEHTPPSDSSTVEKQQKALGDLVKQVIEFRKQEGYDDMVVMEKKKGGKRANNKAAKSTGLDSDVTESDGEETKTSKVKVLSVLRHMITLVACSGTHIPLLLTCYLIVVEQEEREAQCRR